MFEWCSKGQQEEKHRQWVLTLPFRKGCVRQGELKISGTPALSRSDSAAFPGRRAHPLPQPSHRQAWESDSNVSSTGLEMITQSLRRSGLEKCSTSSLIILVLNTYRNYSLRTYLGCFLSLIWQKKISRITRQWRCLEKMR